MLVRSVKILLQLVEKSALELMPHEQVEMRRLVQEVPVRLDASNFLKKNILKNVDQKPPRHVIETLILDGSSSGPAPRMPSPISRCIRGGSRP